MLSWESSWPIRQQPVPDGGGGGGKLVLKAPWMWFGVSPGGRVFVAAPAAVSAGWWWWCWWWWAGAAAACCGVGGGGAPMWWWWWWWFTRPGGGFGLLRCRPEIPGGGGYDVIAPSFSIRSANALEDSSQGSKPVKLFTNPFLVFCAIFSKTPSLSIKSARALTDSSHGSKPETERASKTNVNHRSSQYS